MKGLKEVSFGEYDVDDAHHELLEIEKEYPTL